MDEEKLDPKTEAMLARALSHFHMVTALYRMGLGAELPKRDSPTDDDYRRALEQPDEED